MSLEKLIKKCVQNDRKAQAEVYQVYSGKLFAVCLKYSPNYQEAQDNLQDGFITIFEKIEQFNHKGSFEGWMKRIIINSALQKYRQKNILTLVKDEIPDLIESVEVNEEKISMDFLLEKIQKLPDKYRMVFNLYILDGYSHKEISKELNISVGTSKSNLSRARQILKIKIEENFQSQSINVQN
jgi:RNA polymerase sigma-70 factor (ECF subfamily)